VIFSYPLYASGRSWQLEISDMSLAKGQTLKQFEAELIKDKRPELMLFQRKANDIKEKLVLTKLNSIQCSVQISKYSTEETGVISCHSKGSKESHFSVIAHEQAGECKPANILVSEGLEVGKSDDNRKTYELSLKCK
jgi:hypothetical protein